MVIFTFLCVSTEQRDVHSSSYLFTVGNSGEILASFQQTQLLCRSGYKCQSILTLEHIPSAPIPSCLLGLAHPCGQLLQAVDCWGIPTCICPPACTVPPSVLWIGKRRCKETKTGVSYLLITQQMMLVSYGMVC